MTTFVPNDPRRFWPDDDDTTPAPDNSHTAEVDMYATLSAAPSIPPNGEKEKPATDAHQTRFVPRASSYIPVGTVQQSEELKQPVVRVPIHKEHAENEPSHQEPDEWHIGEAIDTADAFFEKEMREDARRVSHTEYTPTHITPRPNGYTLDDEDAYGIIRTGARGPKQTPTGTLVFITFVVVFIILLTLFLVAFMSNVLTPATPLTSH